MKVGSTGRRVGWGGGFALRGETPPPPPHNKGEAKGARERERARYGPTRLWKGGGGKGAVTTTRERDNRRTGETRKQEGRCILDKPRMRVYSLAFLPMDQCVMMIPLARHRMGVRSEDRRETLNDVRRAGGGFVRSKSVQKGKRRWGGTEADADISVNVHCTGGMADIVVSNGWYMCKGKLRE